MAETSEGQRGTYRCPVCGHRDLAVLRRGEARSVIQCSYCETFLDVGTRGQESVRFSVQIAEEHARR